MAQEEASFFNGVTNNGVRQDSTTLSGLGTHLRSRTKRRWATGLSSSYHIGTVAQSQHFSLNCVRACMLLRMSGLKSSAFPECHTPFSSRPLINSIAGVYGAHSSTGTVPPIGGFGLGRR